MSTPQIQNFVLGFLSVKKKGTNALIVVKKINITSVCQLPGSSPLLIS